MSSVRIKKRRISDDPQGKPRFRWYVYYRRGGGRGIPEEYGGAFQFEKEAKMRRDLIAGEIAALRDPRLLIEGLTAPAKPKPGLEESWTAWRASKRKAGESAHKLYRNSQDRWVPLLGARTDPATITVPDISAGIDEQLDDGLAPNTVKLYLSHLRMVLDFALPDGAPNPARSKKLELPSGGVRLHGAPSNAEWAAILAKIAARSKNAVRLMECCALRVSEACGIEAGDVDRPGGQFLIRRETTKTRAGRRWVPCPPELLETLPLTVDSGQVYYDLSQACKKAKIRQFGTHSFRRRRISLWYAHGVDGPQVARWAGHSKASESMDTYAFEVMDALADEWMSFWDKARGGGHVREEVLR